MQQLMRLWQAGWAYQRLWPLHAVVAQGFVDNRLLRIWRASLWLAPTTALLAMWWAQLWLAPEQRAGLPWLMPALLASLPLQWVLLLGWRAGQPLPPQQRRWLQQLRQRLSAFDIELAAMASPPVYQDLALTLAAFDRQWPGKELG